jgi:ATP-dependent DNA ligase
LWSLTRPKTLADFVPRVPFCQIKIAAEFGLSVRFRRTTVASHMSSTAPTPIEVMLSEGQDEIPVGPDFIYEPKYDGFRCIVIRDGDSIYLQSRAGQPLARYFPEVVVGLKSAIPEKCTVDGEIILVSKTGLDFDSLSQRIHPAASRILKLSNETPAGFVAFDVLSLNGEDVSAQPNFARRKLLESLVKPHGHFFMSPQTDSIEVAKSWFHEFEGAGCDGVIARNKTLPYCFGQRVMTKIKHHRTADCVVGGFREGKTKGTVGSLLLGLFDENGSLFHVGHTSSFSAKEKRSLFEKLQPLISNQTFGDDSKSRWSKKKEETPATALTPTLVCEVRYDFLQGSRFRHATTFLRWRDDKLPNHCLFSQLLPPKPFDFARIVNFAK